MNGLEFVRKRPSGPRVRGGRAVLIARILKQVLGDTLVYNDSLLCAGLGGSPRLSNKKIESHNLFLPVYPNPANNEVNFIFKLPKDESAVLFVYDSYSKLIFKKPVAKNSKQLKLFFKGLSSGIYFFQFNSSSGLIGNGKIILISKL